MTDKSLERVVKDTIKWANELSETWSGTTTGHIIDSQKEHLEYLIEKKEMNLVSVQVLELIQTCKYADKEQDGY